MRTGIDKRYKHVLEGVGKKPLDTAQNFKSHFIKQIKIFTDLVHSHGKSLERVLKMNGNSILNYISKQTNTSSVLVYVTITKSKTGTSCKS